MADLIKKVLKYHTTYQIETTRGAKGSGAIQSGKPDADEVAGSLSPKARECVPNAACGVPGTTVYRVR